MKPHHSASCSTLPDDACVRVLRHRVGGEYGFVHPRLFDFFVDTTLVPIDVSSSLRASMREYPELQRQNVCKIEKEQRAL